MLALLGGGVLWAGTNFIFQDEYPHQQIKQEVPACTLVGLEIFSPMSWGENELDGKFWRVNVQCARQNACSLSEAFKLNNFRGSFLALLGSLRGNGNLASCKAR